MTREARHGGQVAGGPVSGVIDEGATQARPARQYIHQGYFSAVEVVIGLRARASRARKRLYGTWNAPTGSPWKVSRRP